jgi:hypothetical protein
VEVKALLVEGAGRVHLVPRLVTDAVVDAGQGNFGKRHGSSVLLPSTVTGEERSGVVLSRDESVSGVTICADDSCSDGAVLLVLVDLGVLDSNGALLDSLVVYSCDVLNLKGNILYGVAMAFEVSIDLLQELSVRLGDWFIVGEVSFRSQRRGEDEADIVVLNHI